MGCVTAELMLGQPLFPGESGVDQLVEIIKVLGTPTREQIEKMNPNYTEFKFPQINTSDWSAVFRPQTPQDGVDFTSTVLRYVPTDRLSPLDCCLHPFFDELRAPGTTLPSGGPLPPGLFELSEAGTYIIFCASYFVPVCVVMPEFPRRKARRSQFSHPHRLLFPPHRA